MFTCFVCVAALLLWVDTQLQAQTNFKYNEMTDISFNIKLSDGSIENRVSELTEAGGTGLEIVHKLIEARHCEPD
jgi:hypothetical protein